MDKKPTNAVCPNCGHVHAQPRRFAILRRFLPGAIDAAADGWPCLWGGATGARQLYRDLRALGAVATGDRDGPHTIWGLP